MRYTALFSMFLFFAYFGCNKNKFNTKPSLKYKSVNTTTLHRGETLKITLSFTDAEGDLTDTLYIQELVAPCPLNLDSGFKAKQKLPEFPTGKNQQGEIVVSYGYNDVNPLCQKNDTAIFKFVLKDKAQNSSNIAVSEPIVIIF